MRIDPTFQLPDNVSTSSASFDDAYYFVYWVSVVFFVAIVGAMCWFAYKYRKRPGHKPEPTGHNMVLEVAWTIAPIFLLVYLFHIGFKGYMDLAVAPADAIEIRVRASQWNWEFEYPNGGKDDRLHIPRDKNVKLIMSSSDVLHAFYVPELRTKRDLVPGMFTNAWFNASKNGTYTIYCAEYCGGKNDGNKNDIQAKLLDAQGKPQTGHWAMLSEAVVEDYDTWKKHVESKGDDPTKPPEEKGKAIYERLCKSCHSVDGTKLAGPSWKGIFGKDEATSAGPVKVDENYLRESILEPNAKVVTGFAPAMPTFKGQLKDKDIDYVISYIKSLK
jgi:cytochrome c oxidase subunit II